MTSTKTGKSTTTNNQEYFSIEAPHKVRRQNYFWTIVIALTVVCGAVGVTFLSSAVANSNSPPSALTHTPSLDKVANDETKNNNNNLGPSSSTSSLSSTSSKSYHVDMDKQEWPELVGMDADAAKATIQGENPSITKVQIIPEDSMVTMDYVTTRVRIFVKPDNTVARAPRIG